MGLGIYYCAHPTIKSLESSLNDQRFGNCLMPCHILFLLIDHNPMMPLIAPHLLVVVFTLLPANSLVFIAFHTKKDEADGKKIGKDSRYKHVKYNT